MLAVPLVLVLLSSSTSIEAGCGKRPHASRVVNGEDASPNSWPWQISLRHNGRHICGGSLIKPNWIVTAAHCVNRHTHPHEYKVVVGAHRKSGTTSVQQTLGLQKIIRHERYNPSAIRNDIALLKLSSSVRLSDKVNTACLPTQGSRAALGDTCYITGWGRTSGGSNTAEILQEAVLPVVDDGTCSQVNGRLLPIDAKSMLCAGGQGKGGCQGDSGGPFVCEEKGKWVLRGAVSWGHSYCHTSYYTVFTRVSNFVDWINRKTSDCKDNDSYRQYCPHWQRYCSWHTYVQKYCMKSCKLC